jgi:feruloyl esterase
MSSLLLAVSASLAAGLQGGSCQDLASLPLGNAAITSAVSVPAGPYVSRGFNGQENVGPMLPGHCRVAATLTPAPGSSIDMEIWLPARGWNGKFLAVGNGGWAGSISLAAIADGLAEGYAAASNDTGHKGGSGEFALRQPEKVIDFGYRAMHEMALRSKAIIGAYYGRAPELSYFNGCSTGGRQGLMEAQRYPEDFDAIIVGAPVNNVNHLHAAQTQKYLEILRDESRYVPPEKVEMIAAAVLQACDADDGVEDGLIGNPLACAFEPASLACDGGSGEGAAGAMCLAPGQVASLERAWSPVFDAAGARIYPGHARGFEAGWRVPEPGSTPPSLPTDSFRYLGHQDPDWDWRTFDLEEDLALVMEKAGFIESTDPDLSAFRERGGKLLMYHGWNDPGPSPLNSIAYYEEVLATLGPDQDDWMRLYMMPGMGHCRGGPGPDQANFLSALERWVEAGEAPERITAVKVANGEVRMTRPLCPYPQVADWTGTGSANDEANFVCTAPGLGQGQ